MNSPTPPATMKKFLIAAFALGSLGLTACTSEEDPVDKAADTAKEAVDDAKDAVKDATDK